MSESFEEETKIVCDDSEFVVVSATDRVHYYGEISVNALAVDVITDCSSFHGVQAVAASVAVSNRSSLPLLERLFPVSLCLVSVLMAGQVNHVEVSHSAKSLGFLQLANAISRNRGPLAKHIDSKYVLRSDRVAFVADDARKPLFLLHLGHRVLFRPSCLHFSKDFSFLLHCKAFLFVLCFLDHVAHELLRLFVVAWVGIIQRLYQTFCLDTERAVLELCF